MLLERGFSLCGYLPSILDEIKGRSVNLPQTFLHLKPKDEQEALTWALTKATQRIGVSNPNPNVGCLIVANGVVIAEGSTQAFGHWHAEREALETCPTPQLLKGATAYITLEPCAHQGKQPPCVDAIIAAGIKKCVIGCLDSHPLVQGKGIKKLEMAGIEVRISDLKRECTAFNLPFFFQSHYKRPFFVGKWAQTINGLLADDEGVSQWISGPFARRFTHLMRSKYDAILVGAGTIVNDQPTLDARDAPWKPRHPMKILFDPSGRLLSLSDSKVIDNLCKKTLANPQNIVYVTRSPHSFPHWLKDATSQSFTILLEPPRISSEFAQLKAALCSQSFIVWHGSPLQSVLVEGGPTILNILLREGALDALQFFVNTAFLSGKKHHIGTFTDDAYSKLSSMERFRLLQSFSFESDTYLEMIPQEIANLFFS